MRKHVSKGAGTKFGGPAVGRGVCFVTGHPLYREPYRVAVERLVDGKPTGTTASVEVNVFTPQFAAGGFTWRLLPIDHHSTLRERYDAALEGGK